MERKVKKWKTVKYISPSPLDEDAASYLSSEEALKKATVVWDEHFSTQSQSYDPVRRVRWSYDLLINLKGAPNPDLHTCLFISFLNFLDGLPKKIIPRTCSLFLRFLSLVCFSSFGLFSERSIGLSSSWSPSLELPFPLLLELMALSISITSRSRTDLERLPR